MDAQAVITWLTGILVTGEALALVAGMRVIKRGTGPWLNRRNNLLLLSDLAAGPALVAGLSFMLLFIPALLLLVSTHIYRTVEYMTAREIKFCFNLPLLLINLLKLAGLLILSVLSLLTEI